jgi:hypothetical protein
MNEKLRNLIGCADLPDTAGPLNPKFDNLAIMLCTYFDGHPDCPEDQETDEEFGWKPWVIENTNRMLDAIVACLPNAETSRPAVTDPQTTSPHGAGSAASTLLGN